jgi:alpha-L-rhamnosidase
MIEQDGCKLQTGFVGTPYMLHVLSKYGHTDLAYTLLLRKEYPSWLYPISKGATTIWEHWDGIGENGEMWSDDMNSFNHYAYGSVSDWIYEEAAGIQTIEEWPGFEKVQIAPKPDRRLTWLEASIETRHGKVSSKWTWKDGSLCYEIQTPVLADVMIAGRKMTVKPGRYTFWENPTQI